MRLVLPVFAAGIVALVVATIGASRETLLARQMPWLVSGGFAGVGLVALGGVLTALHWRRRAVAAELDALDRAIQTARAIAEGLR